MKYSINDDYKNIKMPYAVAIVPIKDLVITEKYSISNINLYPPNSINRRELNNNKVDFTFNDFEESFFNCTLLTFPIEHKRDNIIGTLMPNKKNSVMSEVLGKSDEIMSIFIYIYCNFDMVSNLPQHSGYIKDIYTGILIFYPELGNSDFIFEKLKTTSTLIGNGMNIDISYDKEIIDKYMSIFNDDCKEVGNIIKHSLRLFSNIIYNNNKTNKFILAMSLIEYLANPYEYTKMQKAKSFILPFSTDSKKEYHRMCERFLDLTGKKVDGVEVGLRTCIVHNGKTIEELIDSDYKVNFILREVQDYICNAINSMVLLYREEWEEVEKEVNRRYSIIENNRKETEDVKKTMDVLFFIDYRFLNNSIKEVYQLYPNHKNKKINISGLLYLIAKQVDIDRKGYTIPVQVAYDKDESIYNCLDERRISELENLGFDSDIGQFDIYAAKANITYDSYMENLLTHYLYEMNYDINETSKFAKIVLISDRNSISKSLYEFAEKSCKKIIVGRLDNKRTTTYPQCTWFDIQILLMTLLNIQPWEECNDNFIYDITQAD